MDDALTAVIESNVQGIDGFLIAVSNDGLRFSYHEYMKTYMPPRTYTGGFHVLDIYGTVQEGGYTVNLFTNEESSILAAHIRQNRFGLIYSSKQGGYLEPDVYKDVDEHEFNEITEAFYGIKPSLNFSPKQKSYFERGNKSAGKKEFAKAIEFYDMGHLHKSDEGNYSFNEALKLDRSLYPKVVNFINSLKKT